MAQIADQILVLQNGRMMENNPTATILNNAEHVYTRQLLSAVQDSDGYKDNAPGEVVIDINNIEAGYGRMTKQGKPEIPILSDISMRVRRGQTVGIIGESGSGKSTFARVIAGLLPAANGSMLLNNKELTPAIVDRSKAECQQIQMVFQNADTALNPAHKVGDILGRPLTFFHGLKGAARKQRVAELLELVKLPADLADRKCGALSGGQKQRINLARALAAEPSVILCDEVTSALDTVVAAAILELLGELQAKLNIAIVFISHDISTVKSLCDEIMVLYKGKTVQYTSGKQFAIGPYEPYTELLLNSVPTLDPTWLDSRQSRA